LITSELRNWGKKTKWAGGRKSECMGLLRSENDVSNQTNFAISSVEEENFTWNIIFAIHWITPKIKQFLLWNMVSLT
jgi:hypothetical protein